MSASKHFTWLVSASPKTAKSVTITGTFLATTILCAAIIPFSDGAFNPPDWTASKILDTTSGASATFSAFQATSGGTPGSYRGVDMTFNNGSIMVAHLSNFVYTPSSQGAITTIDYSYDLLQTNPPSPGAQVAYGPLIFQNNTYYVCCLTPGEASASSADLVTAGGWKHFGRNGLTASSFSNGFGGIPLFGPGPAQPDFSSTGGSIRFGYYSANSSTATTHSGIDNYSVNVNNAAPESRILSQFAFGGGWYSALYFTNTGASAVSVPVNFVADNGTSLNVPSVGTSTTVNLAARGTAIIEAPNVGPLNQGYVSLSLPGGVTGYGVFRQSVPGSGDQEAVVPLSGASSTTSTLIWDDTNFTTAVAIVNPSSLNTMVTIVVRDESGATIGTSALSLAAKSKTAAALRDLPGLGAMAGKRGSADFTVAFGNVAVLGLRFSGAAFTSIPTADR